MKEARLPALALQLLHTAHDVLEVLLEAAPPALAAQPLALQARPLVEALPVHVAAHLVATEVHVEHAERAPEIDHAAVVDLDGAPETGANAEGGRRSGCDGCAREAADAAAGHAAQEGGGVGVR